MSVFTIFNPTTKVIGEEKEFDNYILADKFVKDNYPEGFISVFEPFHSNTTFRAMLNEGTHPSVLSNDRGLVSAIDVDGVITHSGGITGGEYMSMKSNGIPMKQISKLEFIKLHNSLVD